MSSFRDELLRVRQQAETQRLRFEQEKIAEQQRIEQERREAQTIRRQEFERYVLSLKPMVDGLMRDLARATWGYFSYKLKFELHNYRFFADWSVGHDKPRIHESWIHESYSIRLEGENGVPYFFRSSQCTRNTGEEELKGLIRMMASEGPMTWLHHTDHYYLTSPPQRGG